MKDQKNGGNNFPQKNNNGGDRNQQQGNNNQPNKGGKDSCGCPANGPHTHGQRDERNKNPRKDWNSGEQE